jgi:glycosyltransferase involved in cell wall biosynthesis
MALTIMQLLPALEVGGVERGTLEIAQALVARGHRALVVASGGAMVEELRATGAKHIDYPIGRKSLRTLGMIRRLRELIVTEKVDVVHARSRLPAWVAYRALRGLPRARRPRWVTTVHGPYTVNAYSRIMTSGERVIAISEFIRDYIRRSYPQVPAARIRVIPRGIDRTRYPAGYRPPTQWQADWRRRFAALDDRRLLVLPGRLTRWKGHEDFIAVVGELIARGMPVHGLIAGGAAGPRTAFERELKALVAERGLAARITFLGRRDDLREILALADVAFSLTVEPEAFGRTTLEALSIGIPVVGYGHGGTGEILRNILPQGLVAPRDIAGAVATTCAFLAAPVAVPATHPYTLERMQRDTIAIYEELGAG